MIEDALRGHRGEGDAGRPADVHALVGWLAGRLLS
jgi:hypothetical protein